MKTTSTKYTFMNAYGRTVTGTINKSFVLDQLTAFAHNGGMLTQQECERGIITFTRFASEVGLTTEQVEKAIAKGRK